MRKLLNQLYVLSPGAYLSRDGENIVVKIDSEERFRLPIHTIEGIVCFGYQGASPALMQLCAKNGVGLSFHTESGRFLARVNGPVAGNVFLRKRQYSVSEDPAASLAISSRFIAAKIHNERNVLLRAARDHPDKVDESVIHKAAKRLEDLARGAMSSETAQLLRGAEGEAARLYFASFDEMIVEDKTSFALHGRNRRPPLDRVNALLSFLYSLLAHETQSALESVGLDPYVGFLHTIRPGRASLALDLMEELRSYLADRTAVTLINRRQITADDFILLENGAMRLKDKPRSVLIDTWQQRKQEIVIHPFLQEKIPVGLIPYIQAQLLAKSFRNEIDGYPPFFMR
jgi:CRISPR-associated protein Cas1